MNIVWKDNLSDKGGSIDINLVGEGIVYHAIKTTHEFEVSDLLFKVKGVRHTFGRTINAINLSPDHERTVLDYCIKNNIKTFRYEFM